MYNYAYGTVVVCSLISQREVVYTTFETSSTYVYIYVPMKKAKVALPCLAASICLSTDYIATVSKTLTIHVCKSKILQI